MQSAPQCTRSRKDGRQCAARAADWGEPDPEAPLPDPVACWAHLTAREREIALANRARRGTPRPLQLWAPRRRTGHPTSHGLRKSLNKAAFALAVASDRYPGSVTKELNDVMGVDRRAEASKDQLREGLKYVGDRLRALGKRRNQPQARGEDEFASDADPPF